MHMKILWRNDGETIEPIRFWRKMYKRPKRTTLLLPIIISDIIFAEAIIKIAKNIREKGRVDKKKSPLLF